MGGWLQKKIMKYIFPLERPLKATAALEGWGMRLSRKWKQHPFYTHSLSLSLLALPSVALSSDVTEENIARASWTRGKTHTVRLTLIDSDAPIPPFDFISPFPPLPSPSPSPHHLSHVIIYYHSPSPPHPPLRSQSIIVIDGKRGLPACVCLHECVNFGRLPGRFFIRLR